jgi:hypothetical protein
MTKLMQLAIDRLKNVPEARQDEFAGFVLNELQEDERWMTSTAANAGKLEKLIEDVAEADRRGECARLDPDRL